MKLWKKVLIVIEIILIVFVMFIGRRVWILKDLQKKIKNYANVTNYYVKVVANDERQTQTTQTYRKDEQYFVKLGQTDYEYEFYTVTEENFIEPDITEYENVY